METVPCGTLMTTLISSASCSQSAKSSLMHFVRTVSVVNQPASLKKVSCQLLVCTITMWAILGVQQGWDYNLTDIEQQGLIQFKII